MNRLKLFLTVVIFSIAVASCKQDIGNAQWDVDILAPVIKTKLTMADLLADSLVTSLSDGALRLKIEQPLIDLPLDSILKIPDTTVVKNVSTSFALNAVPPGFQLPGLTDETQYQLGDLALKRITIRSGQLRLRLKSIAETVVEFDYFIPQATLYGEPFGSSGSIAAGSVTDTAVAEFIFDLSNYNLELSGLDGTGFNTLTTTFLVNTSENGDTIALEANTPFLVMEYSFLDIVPEYGLGYFGQESSDSQNENSDLDVLNRIIEGQMFLDSVTIGLKIENGVGADARFKLDQLSSINTRTGNTINLNHSIVGNDILLTRAQDVSANAEDVVPYVLNYEVNNANSNIIEFIENLPNQLGFSFGFDLNPLGNVSGGNDFFYYDRPFQAIMDIDVPLRARLDNLTLVDTVDWNLNDVGFIESVNSGVFTLFASNNLPLQGEVSIVLLDENLNEIGELVAPSTIPSPSLNAQGRIDEPLNSTVSIPISEEIADKLPLTRKVKIWVRFNSSNQPNLVEFYDNYGIDIKLVGNFNLNFGTSTL